MIEMKVLVTGGAGYIGSTIAHNLVDAGHSVVCIDSLETGNPQNLGDIPLYVGRVGQSGVLEQIVRRHGAFDVAVHCAAYISVPESQSDPIRYLKNNIAELIFFAESLCATGCRRLVFSSSASLYGAGEGVVSEHSPVSPMSVYAGTKALGEQIAGLLTANDTLATISLRYFNPVGTDHAGRCGPGDLNSGSLLNELAKAALNGSTFRLTGDAWPTRDGSGIRDYVDVNDLARAHVLACETFDETYAAMRAARPPLPAINLGTGAGVTVKEMIAAAQQVLGRTLSVETAPSRPGDVAGSFADNSTAARLLGWKPETPLARSIETHLAWWSRDR